MDIFDRIMELLSQNNMTQADLSRATGISTGLISQWKKRMQSPSAEKLKIVADYFHVSTDYLLGSENKKTPTAPNDGGNSDQDIRRIERARNRMSEEEKEKMMDILHAAFKKYFREDFEDDNTDE